jgi:carboxyl-terminal processing protease
MNCSSLPLLRYATWRLLGGWAAAALLAHLSACGGSSTDTPSLASGYPDEPISCEAEAQRSWLRDYMNDQYYWFDQQRPADAAASSQSAYFESLLNIPLDRYSFTQSSSSFNSNFTEGRRTGFGYALAQPTPGTLMVRYVEPLSPIGQSSLKRGDSIISIDGLSASEIVRVGLPTVSTEGVSRSFVVTSAKEGTRSFTVNSAEFILSPVLGDALLPTADGKQVGYIAYNEFIRSSATPLADAIKKFREAQVSEVIIDMRYNGGGSILVASQLAYLVGGADLAGQSFAQFRFNSQNSANNYTQTFPELGYTTPLAGISRVFMITSGSTASASEMVINGLRPYREVITIGDTTFGKPYAFRPISACNTTYNAVNMQILNAQGFGDYVQGLPATCAAPDDLSRPLGDPQETRIAAALTYINTGSCPARQPTAALSEKKGQLTPSQPPPSAMPSGARAPLAPADIILDENARPKLIGPGAVVEKTPEKRSLK